jgi:hypothetical protein
MEKFYIYLHIKSTNGEPFYVGKGSLNRYKSKNDRNKWWHNTVNKYGYEVIFLEENLTEEEALAKEEYWIKRIGRRDLGNGSLVNMTDGGDGMKNIVFTDEHKKKISIAKTGSKQSDIHKLNISIGNFNKPKSDIHKEKMSKYSKNRTKEHLEKLGKSSTLAKLGKHIYNNGIVNKYFKDGEETEGFNKGKIKINI